MGALQNRQGDSHMTQSCDVGSMPFVGDYERFLEGATRFDTSSADDSVRYFEQKVVEGFLDKVHAGIDVPNFPQFRDMNEMFLAMIDGVEKLKGGGYTETNILSVKADKVQIPEVTALKREVQKIEKRDGPFKIKTCVTGPYTLSSLFMHQDNKIFARLGDVISQVIENNVSCEKHVSVSLVSVDEPCFGLLDDPLIDYGSAGRENLRKAWESIFHKASSKGAQTILHLHDTADELFWEIESLNIVEAHTGDPIYETKRTKERLESTDKFLKASVCLTDFDKLIRDSVVKASSQKMSETTTNQKVADVWKDISHRKIDSKIFLEKVEMMKERLVKIINRFGEERVPYAGPECGLKGFPTYECALECLKRVSSAVKDAAE